MAVSFAFLKKPLFQVDGLTLTIGTVVVLVLVAWLVMHFAKKK